jgi:Tfp pilus assembly protein PilE
MELMLVVAVLGVLVAWSSPHYTVAVEQTRVDAAAAALRSIWIGQRLHCLEHGSYAGALDVLESQRFVDGALLTVSKPFRSAAAFDPGRSVAGAGRRAAGGDLADR